MCLNRSAGHPSWTRRMILRAVAAALAPAIVGGPRFVRASDRLAAASLPPPAPMDTCPVCGMLVAKYPEWIATVVFADGHAEHFDGAKDMFKYMLDMARYGGTRSPEEVVGMAVTEYYDLARIDPLDAWFVIGSDVLGPMGHDLVPLAGEADAREFLSDHGGRAIADAGAITSPLLHGLDEGDFGEANR